jgi:hypothetical protein
VTCQYATPGRVLVEVAEMIKAAANPNLTWERYSLTEQTLTLTVPCCGRGFVFKLVETTGSAL